LSAQGQAKAIETTFNAIHAAKPDPALLAYQYLQTLPQIAQGDANKMWIVPSEFSKALEGLAGLAGATGSGTGSGNGVPSWLTATSTGGPDAGETGGGIPTDGWFDSNLPPAAAQPEAGNLRASDNDPDSRAAHEGMADQGSIDPSQPPAIPPLPSIPPLPTTDELDEQR